MRNGGIDRRLQRCRICADRVPRSPQITSVGNLIAVELGVAVVPDSIANVRMAGVNYLAIVDDPPIARLALAIRPK
jgi:hypothetical protein